MVSTGVREIANITLFMGNQCGAGLALRQGLFCLSVFVFAMFTATSLRAEEEHGYLSVRELPPQGEGIISLVPLLVGW